MWKYFVNFQRNSYLDNTMAQNIDEMSISININLDTWTFFKEHFYFLIYMTLTVWKVVNKRVHSTMSNNQ